MVCVYCQSKTKVTNSRGQKRNNQTWRRRQCLSCKAIFTTHEVIELSSTLVVDVSGVPKPFLEDRLFTDLLLAMQDRSDAYLAAREVCSTIIKNLLKLPSKPFFTPKDISATALPILKRLDKRAALRFASEHPSLQG